MKVVLTTGCFDVFHVGHLYHLQAAAKLGKLYVAVTSDSHVKKGPFRPAFPQKERLEIVKNMRCVSYAFIVDNWQQAMRLAKPSIYVKGGEYEKCLPEKDYCERHGIQLVFTKEPTYSSTQLLHYYADRSSTSDSGNETGAIRGGEDSRRLSLR